VISPLTELKTGMPDVECDLKRRNPQVPVEPPLDLLKDEGLPVNLRGRLIEAVHSTNQQETGSNAASLATDASAKVS